jgi:hypothetical protein
VTLGGSGRLAVPTILLGLLLFALHGVFAVAPSAILTFFAEDVACAFPLLLCTVLLIGVCGPGRISVHRIGGAVVVYLLIGLFFSLLFDIVERLAPHGFSVGSEPAEPAPLGARFFYLSIITLTSVGFGDMAPVHPIARAGDAGGCAGPDLHSGAARAACDVGDRQSDDPSPGNVAAADRETGRPDP